MTSPIANYPKTGIKVIIVGAGFGGITTGIECALKGHQATIIERASTFQQLGDIISISTNAGQIMSRWDSSMVADKLRPLCMNHKSFKVHTHTGEFVFEQPAMPPSREKPMYNGHRADIHRVFYEYAQSLGVVFEMGQRVVAYKEDPAAGKSWVETESGEKFEGHVVVGADGVRSRARKLVLGLDDATKSSGYAVYRAWFNAEESGISTDPLTKEFVENGDTHTGWLGENVHLLVASCKGGREISWVCTHRDDADIDDAWSNPGRVSDVLKILEDWDPRCRAIVSRTPSCVDWKLVYREPLPTWITANGMTCLLGDAAHPFLPTSIQGCSQAIEDGAVLATCLSLSHQDKSVAPGDKIPTALRAYQRLRFERVRAAQATGEQLREKWHKADWTKVRQNPESIRLPREDWLLKHDSEKFVRRLWSRVVAELAGGPEIPRTSLAAGRDTDEFDVEMPPTPVATPVATPREEIEDPMSA